MKPAENDAAFEQFKSEVDAADEESLLDLWIELEDKENRAPDLDVLKELYLEPVLQQKLGLMEWQKAVEARREARNATRS